MSNGECLKIDFSEALRRLPGPQGEHNVALFEHGSLVVKLSKPRGPDLQTPHSRDEIYVVAQGSGEFVCGATRQSFSPNDVLFAARSHRQTRQCLAPRRKSHRANEAAGGRGRVAGTT